MPRPPLPKGFGTHSIATDWKTAETEQDMVYRRGKWWIRSKWEMDSDGRDREFDRNKIDQDQRFINYLNRQTASTGL